MRVGSNCEFAARENSPRAKVFNRASNSISKPPKAKERALGKAQAAEESPGRCFSVLSSRCPWLSGCGWLCAGADPGERRPKVVHWRRRNLHRGPVMTGKMRFLSVVAK